MTNARVEQAETAATTPRATHARASAVVRRLAVSLMALGVASCAASDGGHAAADAGAEASTTRADADPALDQVAKLAAADVKLAPRVAARSAGQGFTRDAGAFVSPGARSAAREPAYTIGGRLPERADLPLRVGIGAGGEYALTLQPIGARSAEGALEAGRVVYHDAHDSTDLVTVAGEDDVEWMYLLRDERAPRSIAFDVTLGRGLAGLRLENTGALLAEDAAGEAMFRITRPYALDARGERRLAGMEYRDGQLRLELDPAGLTYPILLDPAVETAGWELRNSPPTGRNGLAMAYDSTRQRVVLFGGSAGGVLGDTWEFDGTTWTLRSTVGPSPRTDAVAAFVPAQGKVMLFGGADASNQPLGDMWLWDGTVWTQACTGSCTRPPARTGAAMTYDSGRSRAVLFGGQAAGTSYLGDTWEWDGSAWTNPSTSGPSARSSATVAYDAARGQTVLFGGTNAGTQYLADTWVWNGTSWSQKAVSGPAGRYQAAMAYHPDSSQTILYGGWISGGGGTETWSWNGTAWAQLSPPQNAGLHYDYAMVYANALHRLITFGGNGSGATWEWDGSTWSEPTTIPAPRSDPALTFDSAANRTVMYGGSTAGVSAHDTWEWDGFGWTNVCLSAPCSTSIPWGMYPKLTFDSARNRRVLVVGDGTYVWEWVGGAWQRQCATPPCSSTVPTSRWGFSVAYDTARQKTLLFGGVTSSTGTPLNDLWSWDGTVWAKLCTAPACSSAAPAARNDAAVAFDSTRNVLVMFGGATNGTPRNDLWEWDGTQWSQKCTAAPCSTKMPSIRYSAAAAFDSVRGRVVLSGGYDATFNGYLPDAWEWDGAAFVRTDAGTASSMPARWTHAAAYDRTRRRVVVFGGWGAGTYGDTWEYHVRGNGCTVGVSCATGLCVDGVCCESAQCGTCQACNTASNSGACSAITNADDLDTCTGNSTCDAFGACKKKTGQPCAAATECASGSCADGYCCNAACAGGCDECASTPGTCKLRAAGNGGSNPACGGFACTGASGTCPTVCSIDGDCVSTHYCAADGTCQPRRAQGAACNTTAGVDCKVANCRECAAGGCVDFNCCATTSCGPCQSCNGKTRGSCSDVKNADDPDSCAPSAANTCDANGQCKKKAGQACAAGTDCASGFCADGVCCNAACSGGCDVCKESLGASADGQCTLVAAGVAGVGCGNYVCTGASGACPGSCGSDSACTGSAYCKTSDGTCQPDQANGGVCTTGAQCASGFCVDGFCCGTACSALCQACSAGKTGLANGTCGNVTTGTDPDNECAQDPASTCQKDGFCNGAGACRLYTSGTSCGSPTCTAGVASTSTCNGTGTCGSAQSTCAPYACSGTACGTTCTADGECQAGFYCAIGGTCQAKKTQGTACAASNQCVAGNCVDGVCCDTACNQGCQACTAIKKGSGTDGTCGFVKADTDPDSECAASGGTCGATGNCNGAGECKIATAGTVCGATSCTAAVQTGQQCDGKGTCATGSSTTCQTGYTCLNSSVCATSCTDDNQCAGGHYCKAGSCVAAQAVGAACSGARQCAGGDCIDGFCCDGACSGTCQACSNAKTGQSDGKCGPVKVDTDPDNECAAAAQATCQENGNCDGVGACKKWPSGTVCGATTCANAIQTGQICDGSGTCTSGQSAPCVKGYECATTTTCATGCSTDAQCSPTYYCRVTDGTCQPDQTNGASCTSSSQCASGQCVDGVCCDSPCIGTCQACSAAKKGGGADGVCGPSALDTDPDDECASDAPATCQKTGNCDGAGKCELYPQGSNCGANSCADALTLSGFQCDGLGACAAGQTTPCAPFVCSGTSCTASCADDAGCAPGAYCGNDSQCHTKLDVAVGCNGAHECKSGFCVEGLCCNSACDGVCQACTAANKVSGAADGTCGAAKDGVDPHGDCADDRVGAPTSCAHDGLCDGAGACRYYAKGTACGDSSCVGNVQTGHACDGVGSCQPDQTVDCGDFACVVGQCKTACSVDAECSSTAFCDTATSACTPKSSLGDPCTEADTCASGFCVDGVCCNKACDGQCEACDIGTAKGTCSPAVGKPHGKRPECPAGTSTTGDGACAARACDGTNGATCVGYVGADVACRDQACAKGTATFSATCNGAGQCGVTDALQTKLCEPYACGGDACKEKCAADADCAPSYKCDATSGKCISGATCDGDHTISAPGQAPTDCRPYRCQAGGTCKSACASIDDCVEGFVCDSDGRCASPTVVAADAADQGGCGCRVAGERSQRSPTGDAGVALLGLAALLGRRRLRRSAPRRQLPSSRSSAR